MVSAKLLISGNFDKSQINIKLKPVNNRKIDKKIESQINTLWDKTSSDAKLKGKLAYDGDLYRLEDIGIKDNSLLIEISRIKFSVVSSLRKLVDEVSKLGEDYLSKCIAIGGFVRTSNGKYIFAQKTSNTLSDLKVDFIGGLLELPEIKSADDLFEMNSKELFEEAGIKPEQIEYSSLVSVVLSTVGNIIFLTFNQLNIDSSELKANFEKDNDHFELSDLIVVEKEDLIEYLKNLGGYKTVIAEAVEGGKLEISA